MHSNALKGEKQMKTIIYVHPWDGSFNHAILEETKKILTNRNEAFQVIDLYENKFDPVYYAEELRYFSKGETPNQQVKKYQEMLKMSDGLIFVFPIWWFSMPSILKGFLDKVLLKNFAYTESDNGLLTGLLTNIKSVKVITTAQSPKWYIKFLKGDGIKKTFIGATLKSVGMKKIKWIHEGYVVTSKKEKKEKFLKSLVAKI